MGEFSQPTPFESEQGKKGVRVVYLKSRSQPHRMNLQEDYSKISNFALEEKKSKTMEKWLKSKLPSYYVMIDPEQLKIVRNYRSFLPIQKGFKSI